MALSWIARTFDIRKEGPDSFRILDTLTRSLPLICKPLQSALVHNGLWSPAELLELTR